MDKLFRWRRLIVNLFAKIKRKLLKLRLRPIRVFCLHHVSDDYNPLTMWECDWTQTDLFKRNIRNLKEQGYTFISLSDAQKKLKRDWFRHEKYAVLTVDDGFKSLLNILPWLEEQKIPITIFVNTKYLDGKSWSEINEEQARRVKPEVDMLRDVCPNLYLSKKELKKTAAMPNVTIGMHGHEHLDATEQTIEEFKQNVQLCQDALKDVPHVLPYFAYTWGRHNAETDEVLSEMGLTPVLVNGTKNYNNVKYIDRLAIDGKNESSI